MCFLLHTAQGSSSQLGWALGTRCRELVAGSSSSIVVASPAFPSALVSPWWRLAVLRKEPWGLICSINTFGQGDNLGRTCFLPPGAPCPAWNPVPAASLSSAPPPLPPPLASPTVAQWYPDSWLETCWQLTGFWHQTALRMRRKRVQTPATALYADDAIAGVWGPHSGDPALYLCAEEASFHDP